MAIEDPRDLPGVANGGAWYSALHESSRYADNAKMNLNPGMEDLSGNDNHAIYAGPDQITLRHAGGPGNGPRFSCLGGHFQIPNLFAGKTSGEMYMTVQSLSEVQGSWHFGANTANGDESHYPFSGNIYESFGLATGQRQAFAPAGVDLTQWHHYNVYSAAADWRAYLNGVQKHVYAGGNVTWIATPTLYIGQKNGAVDLPFVGGGALVVLSTQKLTDQERSDLRDWAALNPTGGLAETVFPYTPGFSTADLNRINLGEGTTTKTYDLILRDFWSASSGLLPVGSYSLSDHKKAALAAFGSGSISDRFKTWLDEQGLSGDGTGKSISDKQFDWLGGI